VQHLRQDKEMQAVRTEVLRAVLSQQAAAAVLVLLVETQPAIQLQVMVAMVQMLIQLGLLQLARVHQVIMRAAALVALSIVVLWELQVSAAAALLQLQETMDLLEQLTQAAAAVVALVHKLVVQAVQELLL
jgi:hypothetical protein